MRLIRQKDVTGCIDLPFAVIYQYIDEVTSKNVLLGSHSVTWIESTILDIGAELFYGFK